MTWLTAAVPLTVESRPAGAAPLQEVVIATAVVLGMSVVLGLVAHAHRSGRTDALDRLMARAEGSRLLGGLAGWASVPLMVAMASLITALLGMYWDIALHIGVGRDEGPLANPAHYPILFGLFGVSAAGVLACVLPRTTEPGPASVAVSRTWHAPVGGVLLTGAGAYALLGFPLDDVWHRIFGQDVTLWGPTHLMLIGGAGLSLVAMAILYEEGRRAAEGDHHRVREYVLRSCAMGGMLIGLSVFQAEYDFGVPQFRLVLQPLLIAMAAALTLTAARLWVGRGGAVAAVVFYLVVRGGVSVIVGPGLGELWASVPLYLVEALCIELVAVVLARRPLVLGAVAGVLVGTVGFTAELVWTRVAFPLPWTSDMLVEGILMATVGGVAGGVCGGLLALGLAGRLPTGGLPKALFVVSIAAVSAGVANGLVISTPDGLTATIQEVEVTENSDGSRAEAVVRFNRPPTDGDFTWVAVTAWQGGSNGLHIDHLERVDDVTYRTTEPMPAAGTWKTLVRVHDGRLLAAAPLYMPEDAALGEPEVPAVAGDPRTVGDEKLILQRELKDDVPGWLWLVAGLVVLACSLVLIAALGWGTARYSRLRGKNAASLPISPTVKTRG